MQTIKRKIGSFDDLNFTVDLSDYGKTITDIEDVFFSVKSDLELADATLFFKTALTSGIIVSGSGTDVEVAVAWDYNEYDAFEADKIYQAGLFIKFNGDPVADEHVDQTFKLLIEQDFLRA